MSTEQAGIPQHSAVAQQVHHAEQADERKPQPGPAPTAAATVLKPDLDVTPLRAIGKAIRCIVRPYRSDGPAGACRGLAWQSSSAALPR